MGVVPVALRALPWWEKGIWRAQLYWAYVLLSEEVATNGSFPEKRFGKGEKANYK